MLCKRSVCTDENFLTLRGLMSKNSKVCYSLTYFWINSANNYFDYSLIVHESIDH